jgi:sensor histidine kinase YesM
VKKHLIDNLILQLNCISLVAAKEDALQTQKLIKQLIDTIRYKNGRKDQILKIKEELSIVENFLQIFKTRLGDVLVYDIEIDEPCLDFYIPHYTIMAFAENCLYHAFENKEGRWEISITGKKSNNHLEMVIKDNGKGFDTSKYMSASLFSTDYGTIGSTISRLERYYKAEAVTHIESRQELGTSVFIRIPI